VWDWVPAAREALRALVSDTTASETARKFGAAALHLVQDDKSPQSVRSDKSP